MPATTNKQQILGTVQTALKKKYPVPAADESERPVLDEVLYAIVREAATPAEADAAFARMKSAFFDWNEIRVSTIPEVTAVLEPVADAGGKAVRLVEFLQEHFERTYSFSLDGLEKKGLKDAAKQLARYKNHGVNDFALAWVTQRTLGGHAVPLDEPSLRVLRRLGAIDADEEDLSAVRSSVEHYVPKAKGPEFTDLLIQHAITLCVEGTPDCGHCPLKSDCPTGQEVLSKPKPKPKSR